ncbi:hypothetical protein NKI12_02250 [Mesorhizobium australicum]|uniref:Uncharacterized protein n=1 Tax=Mesorhizobium australicum TaxID=536018 RepID=A0ACC6SVK8_9HYPH
MDLREVVPFRIECCGFSQLRGTFDTAHMTDFEAVKVADLICDFYYEIT